MSKCSRFPRGSLLLMISLAVMAASPAIAGKLRFTRNLGRDEVRCLSSLFWESNWSLETGWEYDMIADAEIARTDLNDDGRKDYIFLIEGFDWCGTGGCTLLIGRAESDGTCHLIYDDAGFPNFTVLRARDNGYHRLYTPCETRFDGRRYQQLNPECPTATIWR